MTKTMVDKKRKQDLGIFYTDQRIADFVFEILKIWKDKEEKETGRWESRKHFPSVIDPAVGEGVFLKAAIETGFTKTDYIFGLDIDGEVVKKWKQINLLKEFGGKEEDLEAHFFHQNGLDKIHWEQHKNKYQHKLKQKDINTQQFDAVIGNPPYGGVGLGETELTDDLVVQLANFEILPENVKNNLIVANTQTDLFNSDKQLAIKPDAKQRIKSFAIEILFLERFIQLTKPGGWIAIIIPDGILANSQLHYVREFIAQKTKVLAIVSLPRDTFKKVGTSAKTSILFLQKYRDEDKKDVNYPVFLASINKLEKEYFNEIINSYKFTTMAKSNTSASAKATADKQKIIKDDKGNEVVMMRVDKNLKEMMEEKPASRWDPAYWHPKYNEAINGDPLDNFIPSGSEGITYGAIITGKKNKHLSDGVPVVGAEQIKPTGLDLIRCERTKKGSSWDPKRSRAYTNSLVFVRSGVGSLGKSAVYLGREYINVGCFVDRIKLKNISPFYVDIYLKSPQGKLQIERLNAGVTGTTNISFNQIKSIKIPAIPDMVQKNIESEYKKMSAYHDKAMEAKKKGNEKEYKKNIEIAEKMLKDLIVKTEAVIRGERDDAI